MGSNTSKPGLDQVQSLQKQTLLLERSLENLNKSFDSCTTDLITRNEFNQRIDHIEESSHNISRQLSLLLETTKGQQDQVSELKNIYTKLCEEKVAQQKPFEEMTEKVETKLLVFEEDLKGISEKFTEIEGHLASSNVSIHVEPSEALGIIKSDNMIKKEKIKKGTKKNAKNGTAGDDETGEAKPQAKGRTLTLRNKKEIEVKLFNDKEASNTSDSTDSNSRGEDSGRNRTAHSNFVSSL